MVHYTRVERLAKYKHSSILGSYVSFEENELLRIWSKDSNMCCGTHLNNLAQLQVVKLLHTENSKRFVKILCILLRLASFKLWNSTLNIVNNCLNTNIYSYLETSGGQSSNLYLTVVHFFQHQC